MLAKSSSANIRLVILDYAGLTTNPEDLLKLIRYTSIILHLIFRGVLTFFHGVCVCIESSNQSKKLSFIKATNLKSYRDSSYYRVKLQRSLIVEHHLSKGPLYNSIFSPPVFPTIFSPMFSPIFPLNFFYIHVHQK